MSTVKVFLSYSNNDEKVANQVKHCIESCLGFEVFLSGSKIRTSQDWFKKIWVNLNDCNIFMPLISVNFQNSYFANQELGFALGKRKKIFPVSIDSTKSYGLIYTIQAFSLTLSTSETFINDEYIALLAELYYVIFNDERYEELRQRTMLCLVTALEASSHFKITSIIYNLIKQYKNELVFTTSHLNNIKHALENNPEIYSAGFIFPQFKTLLQSHYRINIDR